jgi:hypothetical protein
VSSLSEALAEELDFELTIEPDDGSAPVVITGQIDSGSTSWPNRRAPRAPARSTWPTPLLLTRLQMPTPHQTSPRSKSPVTAAPGPASDLRLEAVG